MFYKTLIRPYLELCTPAWSTYYVKDKAMIEKVQKRFTRIIPHLKCVPYSDRLAKLKVWSLKNRRMRYDLIEVCKMVHGLSSVKLEDFLKWITVAELADMMENLKKKIISTNLVLHFFSERAINW